MRRSSAAVLIVLVIIMVAGSGIYLFRQQPHVVIYSADAYVQEADSLAAQFHNSTGIEMNQAIGGGSYTLAREIGQGDPASVFISVALSTYDRSYLGNRYSGWAVGFASDQLVLAYSPEANQSVLNLVNMFRDAYSENSSSIFNEAFNNLTSGKIRVGISNASSDPAGLRAYLSLEAAGFLYHNGSTSYYITRALHNGAVVTASNAAELVSPLESGYIGLLYIYKSAAITKGLPYISLPPWINFGNSSLASFYSKFSYNTTSGLQVGVPIYLYISVVANATAASYAMKFVVFAIENNYLLSKYGLRPLKISLLFNSTTPPQAIADLLNDGKLSSAGPV